MWKQINRGGGIAMVLGFFLPWVSVSCNVPSQLRQQMSGGLPAIQLSGYQLAAGTDIQGQHLAGFPSLWFVLVAGIAALVVTLLVIQPKLAALCTLVAMVFCIGPLWSTWQTFEQQRSNSFFDVQILGGLWVVLAGLAGLAAGAVLALTEWPPAEEIMGGEVVRSDGGFTSPPPPRPVDLSGMRAAAVGTPPYPGRQGAVGVPAPPIAPSASAPPAPPAPPVLGRAAPPTHVSRPVLRCPNQACGQPIVDGQLFCSACGQSLASSVNQQPAAAPLRVALVRRDAEALAPDQPVSMDVGDHAVEVNEPASPRHAPPTPPPTAEPAPGKPGGWTMKRLDAD